MKNQANQRVCLPEIADTKPYADYLADLRLHRRSPKTIKCASTNMKYLAAYLRNNRKELRDMTSDDLYRLRQTLEDADLAPTSVDSTLRQLRVFFRWLVETGEIFMDPYIGVKLPRPQPPELHAPTEKEMQKLLAQPDISNKIGIRDRALLEVAYSTASRLGELTRLKVTDPDLEKGVLRVYGKGSKERLVPLGRQAVRWLKTYLRDVWPKLIKGRLHDRLWLGSRCGVPLDDSAIRSVLVLHSRAAGLGNIPPHAIRRACATHMLRGGAHPVQIQFLLGHANLKTLGHYLRLTIADIKKTHARSKPGR